MLLDEKSAVVYGGGGTIGGTVARAFAREGATVFLAGRTAAPLDSVAQDIAGAGGRAETDPVDVFDQEAVDRHADAIAERAGGIDVSFNAISHGDVHGSPLIEMPFEDFFRPISNAMRAEFLTARAVARHMTRQGSGVIMSITAVTARQIIPEVGGTGVTFDAMESLCRHWARELGPYGVRVVWLRTTGIPEALKDTGGEPQPDYGTGARMTPEEHIAWMEGRTMLNRLTTLEEVGNVAAFMASDRAVGMTATAANITSGAAPD